MVVRFICMLNENQGAVMGILTFVYVIATGLICLVNYLQNKTAKKSQQQNVKIQLFKERHETYTALSKWYNIVKTVYSASDVYEGTPLNIKEKFQFLLFQRQSFQTYSKENFADNVHGFIAYANMALNNGKGKELDDETKSVLSQLQNALNSLYIILQQLGNERMRIDLTQYLFQVQNVEKVKAFADAFYTAANTADANSLAILRSAFDALEEDNPLEKMAAQLKFLN